MIDKNKFNEFLSGVTTATFVRELMQKQLPNGVKRKALLGAFRLWKNGFSDEFIKGNAPYGKVNFSLFYNWNRIFWVFAFKDTTEGFEFWSKVTEASTDMRTVLWRAEAEVLAGNFTHRERQKLLRKLKAAGREVSEYTTLSLPFRLVEWVYRNRLS